MYNTLEMVVGAIEGRIWLAMTDSEGNPYKDWASYSAAELGDFQISLSRKDRPEVVGRLHDAGASQSIIAGITGITQQTVSNDVRAIRAKRESEAKHVVSERVDAPEATNNLLPDATVDAEPPLDVPEVPPPDEQPSTNGGAASTTSVGTDGKEYPRATTTPQPLEEVDPAAVVYTDAMKIAARLKKLIGDIEEWHNQSGVHTGSPAETLVAEQVSDFIDMATATGLIRHPVTA